MAQFDEPSKHGHINQRILDRACVAGCWLVESDLGLGFRIYGLGFRVWELYLAKNLELWGFGFRRRIDVRKGQAEENACGSSTLLRDQSLSHCKGLWSFRVMPASLHLQ